MVTWVKSMQHLLTSSSELQLLMVVVMAAPLSASSPEPSLREKSFDRLPLDDVLFTEDVLQEVSARSRIECSKKCVETERCVMCTFHSSPEGPPGLCRLHSQLQKKNDVKQNRPGARSLAYRRRCDGGYLLKCGRCLKAMTANVNYITARKKCGEMGGQLAVTKSLKDVECMWFFAKQHGLKYFWVGADGLRKDGKFRWTDGTLLPDGSSLWANPDPNHKNRDNACVRICLSNCQGGCRDSSCSSQYNYLCQKDVL